MENMIPGRELDAKVAREVMGCKVIVPPSPYEQGISQAEYERRRGEEWKDHWAYHCGCENKEHEFIADDGDGWLKEYSTDMNAVFEVVEKLDLITWKSPLAKTADGKWCFLYFNDWDHDHCCDSSTIAETAPLAICKAALAAIGGSDGKDWPKGME